MRSISLEKWNEKRRYKEHRKSLLKRRQSTFPIASLIFSNFLRSLRLWKRFLDSNNNGLCKRALKYHRPIDSKQRNQIMRLSLCPPLKPVNPEWKGYWDCCTLFRLWKRSLISFDGPSVSQKAYRELMYIKNSTDNIMTSKDRARDNFLTVKRSEKKSESWTHMRLTDRFSWSMLKRKKIRNGVTEKEIKNNDL